MGGPICKSEELTGFICKKTMTQLVWPLLTLVKMDLIRWIQIQQLVAAAGTSSCSWLRLDRTGAVGSWSCGCGRMKARERRRSDGKRRRSRRRATISLYGARIGARATPGGSLRREELSHLISEEEPSASYMCARISSHTYDRQKWVKYHKQYTNIFQSLTSYYTHAGDSKVSNNGKR
jgi:hypothetical protein